MTRPISDIAFTPAVKQAQQDRGSRGTYAKVEQRGGWGDRVIPDLAAFIAEHDSLYLGTANVDGQPYIQHRGGTKGFLKVLDERTLALADFSGNRQYISLGNLSENNKAFIFLMDYPNRRRIKIWRHREVRRRRPRAARPGGRPVLPGRTGARAGLHHRGVGHQLPAAHHAAVRRRGGGGRDATVAQPRPAAPVRERPAPAGHGTRSNGVRARRAVEPVRAPSLSR